MKTFVKKSVVILGLSSAVLLTACSGGNPLEKESPKAVNTFLKEASAKAELEAGMNLHDRQGVMYHACMAGRMNDKPGFCDALYNNMVTYAGQTDGPFKHLTVKQLTDKALFEQREEAASKDFFSAS
jgi:hypothetical protein